MIDEIPYRAAGTYSGASYIERDADARLRKAIKDNQRYPYIVAPRQSGKSSLLVRTWSFLDPAGNRRALVDLSTFAIEDYETFWRSLLDEIARSAEITDPGILPDRPEDTLSAWLKRFPAQRLVVFIDEIDTLITAPFRDQFFSKIRSLFNKRATDPVFKRLQIILAGAAHPSRLIQDHMRSPFNVGVEIQLDELTEARIRELAAHLEGADARVDASVAERLHAATGGSVYLCQLALEQLWTQATEKPQIGPTDVDEAITALVDGAGREVHFRNIYELVANNARLLAAFARLREGESIDERSTQDLRLSGLSDGTTPYRNEVYRRVFGEGGTLDLVKLTIADPAPPSALVQQASPAPALLQAAPPPAAEMTFAAASAPMPAASMPVYPDEAARVLSEQIARAYQRKQALDGAGLPSGGVVTEIANLRSQLREGGDFVVGDVLCEGRYHVLENIGRGAFATVWRAHDRVRGRDVAIKVLHASLGGSPERRARFRDVAELMASLDHPAIVQVLDSVSEEGGLPYFVMDLVKGLTLQEAVLQHKIGPERAIAVIVAVGAALTYLHERGIVHRNVSPSSIFLDETGEPKLSDFDLVLFEGSGAGTLTGPMGTVGYIAPEMLHEPDDTDPGSDVYSLAMTAIFCLRGAVPRTSYQRSGQEIDTLDCSTAMKQALKRATSWDRKARFASVAAFCQVLRAASAAAEEKAPVTLSPGASGSAPKIKNAPVARPRPAGRVAATIGVVGLMACGFLAAYQHTHGSSSSSSDIFFSTGAETKPPQLASAWPVLTATVSRGSCPAGMVPVPPRRRLPREDRSPGSGPAVALCIDASEVTVARYRACTEAGSCPLLTTRFTAFCNSDSDRALRDHPVNCVTFTEAGDLCRSRGARLPRENEWVQAATGDDDRRFPWGNELLPHPELRLNACDSRCALLLNDGDHPVAPLFEGSDGWLGTAPVGSYPAGDSPVGAHDLAGNVAEWTIGPSGPVVHGGSWHDSTADAVSAAHGVDAAPETRSAYIGFRCATDASP